MKRGAEFCRREREQLEESQRPASVRGAIGAPRVNAGGLLVSWIFITCLKKGGRMLGILPPKNA